MRLNTEWHLFAVTAFYNASKQDFGKTIIPSYRKADDFLAEVDKGRVGVFAPLETKDGFAWRTNAKYQELNFGFTSVVYNIQHKAMMQEIYCSFAQYVAKHADSNVAYQHSAIYEDAKRMGCSGLNEATE